MDHENITAENVRVGDDIWCESQPGAPGWEGIVVATATDPQRGTLILDVWRESWGVRKYYPVASTPIIRKRRGFTLFRRGTLTLSKCGLCVALIAVEDENEHVRWHMHTLDTIHETVRRGRY